MNHGMELSTVLTAAVGVGFVGSLHCAAMCGPIAAGACARGGQFRARAAGEYLLGRFLAYAFAGAVFGVLGHHAVHATSVATVGRGAAALAGIVVALHGMRLLVRSRQSSPLVTLGSGPPAPRRRWFPLPTHGLALGLVTGILPCGLLMSAWMLAASTGSPMSGAAAMTAFAAASVPGLAVGFVARASFGRALRRIPATAVGVAWCALGIWLAVWPYVGATMHSGHGGHG